MQNNMCACVRCAAIHDKLRYLYAMLLAFKHCSLCKKAPRFCAACRCAKELCRTSTERGSTAATAGATGSRCVPSAALAPAQLSCLGKTTVSLALPTQWNSMIAVIALCSFCFLCVELVLRLAVHYLCNFNAQTKIG